MNPRNYILANKTIAQRNGCDIVNEVVCDVDERRQPGADAYVRLTIKRSRAVITARKVLLCTGGFINFERLLPNPGLEIDIDPLTEMAVLIELSREDAERMSNMPSILVFIPDAKDPRNSYILPPVKYPDGKSDRHHIHRCTRRWIGGSGGATAPHPRKLPVFRQSSLHIRTANCLYLI